MLKPCSWGLAMSAVLCALVGCGEGTGTVSGTATYEGKPITRGTVNFIQGEKTAYGPINDGRYEAAEVPTGECKVTVSSFDVPAGGAPGGEQFEAVKSPKIPDKYATADMTPLKLDVTGGRQTHDITLTP